MPPELDLRETAINQLGTSCRPLEELVDSLALAMGLPRSEVADELEDVMAFDSTFVPTSGGIIYLPAVFEGTTWTVAVDPDEARDAFVRVDPDLSALTWWLIEDGVEVIDADGTVIGVHEVMDIDVDGVVTDVLMGPAGWVGSLGQLTRVDVIDSCLRWTTIDEAPNPTQRQLETIATAFEAAVRSDELDYDEPLPDQLDHTSPDQVMCEALALDRAAFVDAPIPRIPDLFSAADLEVRGSTVACVGFDWDALGAWRASNRMQTLYGLDRGNADSFALLSGACRLVIDGDVDALGTHDTERADVAQLLAILLDQPASARALWQRHIDEEGTPEELARFADELQVRLGDQRFDGVDWLRARCLDHLGQAELAVEILRETNTRGTDHPLVLIELAGHLADAGDAVSAMRLLQADDVSGDHDENASVFLDDIDVATMLFREVREFSSIRPRPTARRNDSCPCGSGRKYKACHLGKETISLDDRAGWLSLKAERFARARSGTAAASLVDVMIDPANYSLREAMNSAPFVIDMVLHEYGVFEEFLAHRNQRLPDDEALLAAQWELTDRSVFEVLEEGEGTLRLRDLGTGDVITVVNVAPADHPPPGTVVVGRPLPVGDTYRSFSGLIEWPRHRVSEMLDVIEAADPFEIAALVGSQFRPPTLTNTEGDDLVFTTLRWHLPPGSSDTVRAGFETIGIKPHSDSDDQPTEWTYTQDTPSMQNAVIVSFRLEGDELVAEVNSAQRSLLARELVAEAVPDADLVDMEEKTMAEAMESYDPDSAPPQLDHDDPEIRAILETSMRQMEQRWLDDHIPALGGRTPRDAVGDPVGREEVVNLLASFPEVEVDVFNAMSPQRLRNALDL